MLTPSWAGGVIRLMAFGLLVGLGATVAVLGDATPPGRCAMYGQCGPKSPSIFAPSLPCAVDQSPVEPSQALRDKLADVCGAALGLADGPGVCCDEDQLDALAGQTQVAYNLIGACPACWNNFMNFFCQFTCSPQQADFLNVTDARISPVTGDQVAARVDLFVDPHFGAGFYESCQEVKFPADNSFVMDLLGGGARNYLEMLRFLGTERLGGSPFQIDIPDGTPPQAVTALDAPVRHCNDTGSDSRCACVDCSPVCPILDPVPPPGQGCRLPGNIPCWSLLTGTVYVGLGVLFTAALFLTWRRHRHPEMDGFTALLDHDPGLADDTSMLAEEDEMAPTTRLITAKSPAERLHLRLHDAFYRLGFTCATHPRKVLALVVAVVLLTSLGWRRFEVETSPERLWVGPQSTSAQNKRYFDDHFGPFYRTQQVILTAAADDLTADQGPSVITERALRQLFLLDERVRTLRSAPNNFTLDDFCLSPTGDGCVVQSVTGYWGFDLDNFEAGDWRAEFEGCAQRPVDCLPDFGQPLKPAMLLGGYPDEDYDQARALFVTYVLTNSQVPEEVARREEWEAAYVDLLQSVQADPAFDWTDLHLSFSSERSIEAELQRSTYADVWTIALSYLVMFLYASIALGRFSRHAVRSRRFLIETKFGLGLGGIVVVLASVSMSTGILSLLGVKATLIIAEVIPFLVLAVGVDNIFLLVNELDRQSSPGSAAPVEQRVAAALAAVGPSVLLAAVAETLAFGLGAFVSMPAVSAFALYAALAVWFDFVLQVTGFVALLTLDTYRTEAGRADLWPWVTVAVREDPTGTTAIASAPSLWARRESWLQWFMGTVYAPLLTHRSIRWAVFILFSVLFAVNVHQLPRLELGLDQRVALPRDSYLVDYFDRLDRYFGTGPPVYFVTKHANVTDQTEQRTLCGRFTTCADRSLANLLEQERKRPEVSFLAQPAAVWLDDYFHWLNPAADTCCRERPGPDGRPEPCDPYDEDCAVCWAGRDPAWNITLQGLPQGDEFLTYLNFWLAAPPSAECPLAGAAAYGDAVARDPADGRVVASHVRTFHVPLGSQRNYIAAFDAAHRIAADASRATGASVFPYSVFYIFFDQYAHIGRLAVILLGVGGLAIGVVTAVLLANVRVACLTMLTVALILAQEVAAMAAWGVTLNALSLVNLMIGLGVSVEFCCHIARKYVVTPGSPDTRLIRALAETGSSVFSGIALTKFSGVIVLAFARSKIFEVYYFRMYLAMVLAGVFHGLVLLPVLLHTLADLEMEETDLAAPSSLLSHLWRRIWPGRRPSTSEGTVFEHDDGIGPQSARDLADEDEVPDAQRLVMNR
ncbi:niemann-Pick type C- protein 1 [Tieghemiomyces parasiticus]|uniref:Niemann-Pick type C- protein 1 n=1 Tax=Tieghemiomyces parasiticus TaxID=78921 RepID=A0A9W8AF88_9FUNG|nr:niemann-Pick type C- protein 1 [Tieghemiomyces parasiticus]